MYLPQKMITMWGSSHYTCLIDWVSSPCPGIVFQFSARAKQPSLVIPSFIIWIKLVDWKINCHLKAYMEIWYQSKQPNKPISSYLMKSSFDVHSILVLSAHLSAVHDSQMLQTVILYPHQSWMWTWKKGRFLEHAGCGIVSTEQLILKELLENVF